MYTKVEHELNKVTGHSLIALVDGIIETALERNASDIHFEPTREDIRVRLRIDGVLIDAFSVPKRIASEILTRIKVLCGLRTDIHLAPQDGRFRFNNANVDIRVSVVPTVYGENAVLRILRYGKLKGASDLGLGVHEQHILDRVLAKSHGMVVITGPTGSGKTSTLYTLLSTLNSTERSIVTIEDPVEFEMQNTTQVQINHKTGLSFAAGLRSMLRQDPDVIMVGEIRDGETASIAVNSALTGHQVFTTLHTNDAASTFLRLRDMGVDPYLLAAVINLCVAQRLVRMICSACKRTREISAEESQRIEDLNFDESITHVSYGEGCEKCRMSGYDGRTGIFELLECTPEIRTLILSGASAVSIQKAAAKSGALTLIQNGLQKVASGITTLEEILRVFNE